MDLSEITWACHVCGEIRPDDKISVYSREITLHEVKIKQNVRYCNDRPACLEGAKKVNFLTGPAHYELTKEEQDG